MGMEMMGYGVGLGFGLGSYPSYPGGMRAGAFYPGNLPQTPSLNDAWSKVLSSKQNHAT